MKQLSLLTDKSTDKTNKGPVCMISSSSEGVDRNQLNIWDAPIPFFPLLTLIPELWVSADTKSHQCVLKISTVPFYFLFFLTAVYSKPFMGCDMNAAIVEWPGSGLTFWKRLTNTCRERTSSNMTSPSWEKKWHTGRCWEVGVSRFRAIKLRGIVSVCRHVYCR